MTAPQLRLLAEMHRASARRFAAAGDIHAAYRHSQYAADAERQATREGC